MKARVAPGENIFVHGGSGGVGSAVVQLAKWAGARVITTAVDAEKRRFAANWGADLVLDYRDPKLTEKILDFTRHQGGVHVWFETRRDFPFSPLIDSMAFGGRIVLVGGSSAQPSLPLGPFYFKDLSLLGLIMMKTNPEEQRHSALAINACFEDGGWHPPVGKVFSLADSAEAHSFQEEKTLHGQGSLTGKIIVKP